MENVCSQSSTGDIRPDHLNRAASSGGRAYSGSLFLTCSLLPDSHGELDSPVIQDIMTLRDARRTSMVYFDFDFKDVDNQKLQNLFPSLFIQISPSV